MNNKRTSKSDKDRSTKEEEELEEVQPYLGGPDWLEPLSEAVKRLGEGVDIKGELY